MGYRSIRYEDPRGGHVRIYWEILDSHAWQALSWAEQGLYIALRRRLKKNNNGDIEATLSLLRHYGVTSSASLAKGLRALMAVGLIQKTRQGLLSQGRRTCNLFRFTDEAVYELPSKEISAMPATNEWRRLTTRQEAKAAIAEAHSRSRTGGRAPTQKNAKSFPPVTDGGSNNESKQRKTTSEREGATVIQFIPRSRQ